MKIKVFLKKVIIEIILKFRIRNIILFESTPDYSDNTKNVFDEMLKRGINNNYKLIWICEDAKKAEKFNSIFSNIKNVDFLHYSSLKYKIYYKNIAKAFIVCNQFLPKVRNEQYYCDLAHGCALKNACGTYSLPEKCFDADVMTISNYMAPYDAHNLMCDISCMKVLGYARNDDLFKKFDVKSAFPDYKFEKIIYWLPTYRQNCWKNRFHSDISMPIIYDRENAEKLNEAAKNNNILIVVKIHPVQDISRILEFNFSNLVFIKNDFFDNKDFTNYQLLGSSDAMLSDYSSVYYDYLLCDKPIGLCWDDFEEYNKREGFTLDPDFILKGGEKIYNIDDLCDFISRIANEEDNLKTERNEIKNLVHDHIDDKSTVRIVDFLEKKLV